MNEDERAELVELLRCAAEMYLLNGGRHPIATAHDGFGDPPGPLFDQAIDARGDAYDLAIDMGCSQIDGHWALLEAAQRVESGEWR